MTNEEMNLKNKTLAEVNQLWNEDKLTREEVQAYLEAWNTATFRFTKAVLIGDNIMQFDNKGE